MNYYEEVYQDTVLYSVYERDIEERDRKIEKLQDENYKLTCRIEELEEVANEKITFQNQKKICEEKNKR